MKTPGRVVVGIFAVVATLFSVTGRAEAHRDAPGQAGATSNTDAPRPKDIFAATARRQGVRAQLSLQQIETLSTGRDASGNQSATPMEFSVRLACQTAQPGEEQTAVCHKAVDGCLVNGQVEGIGLLHEILARPAGSTGQWRLVGLTCFADRVPGATPMVTMAMIRDALHTTPWAKAVINTQPAGDVTLVRLDTFYRVTWSAEGFQPGEVEAIDPARMLGFRVEIRPRVHSFTYVFGDGERFGPTRSEGGVYPHGDITHAYRAAGTYQARVDTTFTGDFRINGGPWTPIPDQVTVEGPATTVTVKTARAVLVS